MSAEQSTLCVLHSNQYGEILDLWRRAGLPVRAAGRDAPGAFARQMASGMQHVLGLRDGERLIAAVVLTSDGRKGWINRLAVDPAHRRQGHARRLVAEAERFFAEELGLNVWAALIEEHNAASLALFDALDYERPAVRYVSRRTSQDA